MSTSEGKWLIYGAYGYSGRLVLEEAVKRGHVPVIAGRNEEKVRALGEEYGLEWRSFSLEDEEKVASAIKDLALVLNCAGPFVDTAETFIRACLRQGVSYMDITGEIPVFQMAFSYQKETEKSQILILPGVGFDVVPTDCLAVYLKENAEFVPESLEIAFSGFLRVSRGTARTMLRFLSSHSTVRRGGRLVSVRSDREARVLIFPDGEKIAMPISWGDLETAWRSTGIPDITVYIAYPKKEALFVEAGMKVLSFLIKIPGLRKAVDMLLKRALRGPSAEFRRRARVFIWGRVKGEGEKVKEAFMETPEAYLFTALSAVRCVEEFFLCRPAGVHTPATAFGWSFVTRIPGVRMFSYTGKL